MTLSIAPHNKNRKGAPANPALWGAQLKSRHWVVRNSIGDVLDHISGEGVVGQFPLLKAGGLQLPPSKGPLYARTSCLCHAMLGSSGRSPP